MSVEEIMRYVRQTPGNTNPSVVGSMVNAEMNSTLEEAKKYTDSQRLGYTEPNVLIFDGNPDNIVNEYMVKISDNVYDLNSIVSITFQMGDETNKFDKSVIIHNDEISVGTEEYPAMVASFGDVVANILGIEPGTYFFYSIDPESNEKYYVSRVEFVETVHQIDPKFIPGAYEKTVLFNGKPTKLDLTSISLGYAYMLSSEDIFSLAYGQNVHFEYTLANGVTAHGVLETYLMMDALGVPMVYDSTLTLLYSSALGGTGVSFNYADVGEVANLKLWTEYSENGTYYITTVDYSSPPSAHFLRFEEYKAKLALRSGRAIIRWGIHHWTPLNYSQVKVDGKSELNIRIFDEISVDGGEFRKIIFVDGVYQSEE